MNAGRELDALVAEKVMGSERQWWENEETDAVQHYPRYSTDIAAAWQVVEKLAETYDVTVTHCKDPLFAWECYLEEHGELHGFERIVASGHPTAPLAICLAALRAVGHSFD